MFLFFSFLFLWFWLLFLLLWLLFLLLLLFFPSLLLVLLLFTNFENWIKRFFTHPNSPNNLLKLRNMCTEVDKSIDTLDSLSALLCEVVSEKRNQGCDKGNISKSDSVSNKESMCLKMIINNFQSRHKIVHLLLKRGFIRLQIAKYWVQNGVCHWFYLRFDKFKPLVYLCWLFNTSSI